MVASIWFFNEASTIGDSLLIIVAILNKTPVVCY